MWFWKPCGKLLDRILHGQHQGNIVVNAKDPQRNPVVISDVDGGGHTQFAATEKDEKEPEPIARNVSDLLDKMIEQMREGGG